MSKLMTIDGSTIKEAVEKSASIREILSHLGFLPHVTYYSELRVRCQELDIELPTYRRNSGITKQLKDILVENSSYSTTVLKRRLIKEGILEDRCAECGQLPLWNSKPLVLQLDHINGVSNDHRLENLRILCGHCHSQTDTWCGRGKPSANREIKPKKPRGPRKPNTKVDCPLCDGQKSFAAGCCIKCSGKSTYRIQWPDDPTEIVNMIKETNFIQTGLILGVSDNSIRKYLKRKGIDSKNLSSY